MITQIILDLELECRIGDIIDKYRRAYFIKQFSKILNNNYDMLVFDPYLGVEIENTLRFFSLNGKLCKIIEICFDKPDNIYYHICRTYGDYENKYLSIQELLSILDNLNNKLLEVNNNN